MILIDNYDSFTYNIVQAFQSLGQKIEVIRNRALTASAILSQNPQALIIGPGPGNPLDAGVSTELIRLAQIPLLGICLGHQAIGEVYGGKVTRADRLMHGKTSPVYHKGTGLFRSLPNPFLAARYHSLILKNIPESLTLTAWTEEGEIMGISHTNLPLHGIQFHPESIATQKGDQLLKNFIDMSISN